MQEYLSLIEFHLIRGRLIKSIILIDNTKLINPINIEILTIIKINPINFPNNLRPTDSTLIKLSTADFEDDLI